MKKILIMSIVILLIVAAASGCMVSVGNQEYGMDNTDISVSAGQSFTIKLEENPTTGYQWSIDNSDESIVKLDEDNYQQEPGTEDMTGSGGYRLLTFKALKQGNAVITLVYERSFEENSAVQTLEFKITVK